MSEARENVGSVLKTMMTQLALLLPSLCMFLTWEWTRPLSALFWAVSTGFLGPLQISTATRFIFIRQNSCPKRSPDVLHWGCIWCRRNTSIVKTILTEPFSQTGAFSGKRLRNSSSRKGGLQVGSLGTKLLVLSLDVILAVLTVILQKRKSGCVRVRVTGWGTMQETQFLFPRFAGRCFVCRALPTDLQSHSKSAATQWLRGRSSFLIFHLKH